MVMTPAPAEATGAERQGGLEALLALSYSVADGTSHALRLVCADERGTEVGDHRRIDAPGTAMVPSLSDDVGTLLAATVIDVCAATGVPFCAVSRVRGDDAIVAAAQGAGPAGFMAGAAWRVSDSPPARQALATGRAVLLVARDDPRLTAGQRNALTGHPDMHSLAFMPLLAGS
jgi:hypothetical protein